MENVLLLLFILALFLLPAVLQMRAQRKRLNDIRQVQQALVEGDRVVTSSGIFGRVVGRTGETVALEIAPGVVTTWESIAIVRKIDPAAHSPEELTEHGAPAEASRRVDAPSPESQYPPVQDSVREQRADVDPEHRQHPEDERG